MSARYTTTSNTNLSFDEYKKQYKPYSTKTGPYDWMPICHWSEQDKIIYEGYFGQKYDQTNISDICWTPVRKN